MKRGAFFYRLNKDKVNKLQTKTIKEIRELYNNNELNNELIEQLRHDERKGVQAILAAFDRAQLKHKQLIEQFHEMSKIEASYRARGKTYIAGVDEAGRGPLAGPVVAAAVMLPEDFQLIGLTDSKQLTEEQRQMFFEKIKREAISYHIAIINNDEIDQINIYEATKKAMTNALLNLNPYPDHALIDAVNLDSLPFSHQSIIKGDEHSISIAAASVLAKVTRDELMKEIDQKHPGYGFKTNMGYGTKEHLLKIEQYGITKYHRTSFAPVKRFINGGDR